MFTESDSDDLRIVEECLEGNGKAYEVLVEKYYRVIFRLAGKFTRSYDDAEEITQAVFVKAYENLKSFKPKYRFFSWLYRITVNEAINYGKKSKRTEAINEEYRSLNDNPDIITEIHELSSSVEEALTKIDIIYRVPVVLKHFDGYSYKEISEILEIPEKTVKSRLFTGRQLLKELLKKRI